MRKTIRFMLFVLVFVMSLGLLAVAADSWETDSTLEPFRKKHCLYSKEEIAERDKLFSELEFWELQEISGGILVPSEGGGYEVVHSFNEFEREECQKEIERRYQELENKFGVRRLTQEEAEKEFGFKKERY